MNEDTKLPDWLAIEILPGLAERLHGE